MEYVDVLRLSKLFEFIEILIMEYVDVLRLSIGQTCTNGPIFKLMGEWSLLFDLFFMFFYPKGFKWIGWCCLLLFVYSVGILSSLCVMYPFSFGWKWKYFVQVTFGMCLSFSNRNSVVCSSRWGQRFQLLGDLVDLRKLLVVVMHWNSMLLCV